MKWLVLLVVLLLGACAPAAARTLTPAPTASKPEQAATGLPAALPQASAQPGTDTPVPTPTLAAPGQTAAPQQTAPAGLKGPLSVVIASPADNAVVQVDQVDITGEADPETVISFDDQVLVVGPEGKFSQRVALAEGPNVIEITASDPAGNQGTVYLTITYDPNP